MFLETRKFFRLIGKVILSIPLENELNEEDKKRVVDGPIEMSEFYPLAYDGGVALIISKDLYRAKRGFRRNLIDHLTRFGGYHSSRFNCNGGLTLSRKQLKSILAEMEDSDRLMIVHPDDIDVSEFLKGDGE